MLCIKFEFISSEQQFVRPFDIAIKSHSGQEQLNDAVASLTSLAVAAAMHAITNIYCLYINTEIIYTQNIGDAHNNTRAA